MSACAWCGADATTAAEVEPAVYGTKRATVTENGRTVTKNVKVIKRRPIVVPVCRAHSDMVERNRSEKAARELEKRMERERRRRGTGPIR